jgi:hypothetical protein
MKKHKEENRADPKKDEGMTYQSITKSFETRGLFVLLDGHCPDVPDSASAQVARGGVMKGVFPPPVGVWSVSEQSGDSSQDIICLLGLKKRTMAAVMEQNKCPDQKSARKHSKREGKQ